MSLILYLQGQEHTLYSISMKAFLYIFLSFFLVMVTPVKAAEEGIAVIVNDGVITHSDIRDRLKLIMQSAGIPNTKEMRQKMTPQITNILIEEQLKIQEANELEIEISQEKVLSGFADIAKQNNIPADKFEVMLNSSGININTLYDQIRAEMAWGKVIGMKVRPRIDVTESDIDAELSNLANNIGGNQYLISEIFLNVESPSQDAQTKQSAQKLYGEAKSNPNAFSKIASQFSQSAGSAQGGNLGWVETDQLDKDIETALAQMNKGDISAPIRGISGYHIILLRDKRAISNDNMPTRDEILSKIGNQRLTRQAKGYMLDLKASAFIENRV